MTKEQLFSDYLTTMNKVYELRGNSIDIVDVEKEMKYFNPRSFSKESLERKCKCALHLYEEEVQKLRITAYFATDEGKKVKADTDTQIEKLTAERKEYTEKTKDLVVSFIKAWLGNEWDIRYFSSNSLEIGLVDSEKNDLIFGHTFTIYYGDMFDKKKRLEMNYGCMGSFDLTEDNNTRSRYLLGMGLFSTNKEKLAELKSMLDTYANKMSVYYDELDKLERVLKNPFQNEKEIA